MNLENSQVLIDIFNNTDLYMLIFVRIIGFLIFMPVIGGSNGIAMVKIGLAMAISAIIFTSGNITEVVYANNIMGYFMLILKEFFVGFIISYIVFFIFHFLLLSDFYYCICNSIITNMRYAYIN